MITIDNVLTLSGSRINYTVETTQDITIDGSSLLLMPALIDSHVHFRVPGYDYKENWISGAKAAICGGYTTVFDMPNTTPPTITKETLIEKQLLIDSQLHEANIPLRYKLYLGADKNHFDEIEKSKDVMAALKIFMSFSTGSLLMDDDSSLHAAFAIAKAFDVLICIHAEDQETIDANLAKFKDKNYYAAHSDIRSIEAAALGVKKAIKFSRIYKTRLHILHISTQEEIQLIKAAKREGLPITCETTPHHLFLNTSAYEHLYAKAQVNPPLRSKKHQEALFEAIREGVIDTIGSDHAPHSLSEKSQPYPKSCSGMPGIETTLALLLNACNQGLLSLNQIVSLTCTNVQDIFKIPPNDDVVLVDMEKEKIVNQNLLQTKCQWSAFEGIKLKGWPVYVIMKDRLYLCENQDEYL